MIPLSYLLAIQYPAASILLLIVFRKAKVWKYSMVPTRALWSILAFLLYLISLVGFLLPLAGGWSSEQIAFVFFVGMAFPVAAYLILMLSDKAFQTGQKHKQMRFFASVVGVLLVYGFAFLLATQTFDSFWGYFGTSLPMRILAYVLVLPIMWIVAGYLWDVIRKEKQKEGGEWEEVLLELIILFLLLTIIIIF